ncbi:hypothetical protein CYMTET_22331 [Cymbomonas tetramitiformis]|uniref:Uncharacterized protein n=1 Tax=Cymbomonas tetramitiformis TaxID=36881 RepID=A0AAE0G0G7_9CHLO|nr:hypothetical protein CYMTET_22331 [Cymbomonas tetramitiformis]
MCPASRWSRWAAHVAPPPCGAGGRRMWPHLPVEQVGTACGPASRWTGVGSARGLASLWSRWAAHVASASQEQVGAHVAPLRGAGGQRMWPRLPVEQIKQLEEQLEEMAGKDTFEPEELAQLQMEVRTRRESSFNHRAKEQQMEEQLDSSEMFLQQQLTAANQKLQQEREKFNEERSNFEKSALVMEAEFMDEYGRVMEKVTKLEAEAVGKVDQIKELEEQLEEMSGKDTLEPEAEEEYTQIQDEVKMRRQSSFDHRAKEQQMEEQLDSSEMFLQQQLTAANQKLQQEREKFNEERSNFEKSALTMEAEFMDEYGRVMEKLSEVEDESDSKTQRIKELEEQLEEMSGKDTLEPEAEYTQLQDEVKLRRQSSFDHRAKEQQMEEQLDSSEMFLQQQLTAANQKLQQEREKFNEERTLMEEKMFQMDAEFMDEYGRVMEQMNEMHQELENQASGATVRRCKQLAVRLRWRLAVNSIKAEQHRAQQMEELYQRVQDADTLAEEYNSLSSRLETAEDALRAAQDRCSESEVNAENLAMEVSAKELQANELEEKLRLVEGSEISTQPQRSRVSSHEFQTLDELDLFAANKLLEEEKADISLQLGALREQFTKVEIESGAAESRLKHLEKELGAAQAQLADAEKRAGASDAQRAQLHKDLAISQGTIESLIPLLNKLNTTVLEEMQELQQESEHQKVPGKGLAKKVLTLGRSSTHEKSDKQMRRSRRLSEMSEIHQLIEEQTSGSEAIVESWRLDALEQHENEKASLSSELSEAKAQVLSSHKQLSDEIGRAQKSRRTLEDTCKLQAEELSKLKAELEELRAKASKEHLVIQHAQKQAQIEALKQDCEELNKHLEMTRLRLKAGGSARLAMIQSNLELQLIETDRRLASLTDFHGEMLHKIQKEPSSEPADADGLGEEGEENEEETPEKTGLRMLKKLKGLETQLVDLERERTEVVDPLGSEPQDSPNAYWDSYREKLGVKRSSMHVGGAKWEEEKQRLIQLLFSSTLPKMPAERPPSPPQPEAPPPLGQPEESNDQHSGAASELPSGETRTRAESLVRKMEAAGDVIPAQPSGAATPGKRHSTVAQRSSVFTASAKHPLRPSEVALMEKPPEKRVSVAPRKSKISSEQLTLQGILFAVLDEVEKFEKWVCSPDTNQRVGGNIEGDGIAHTPYLRRMFGIRQEVTKVEREFEAFRLKAGESSKAHHAMEQQMSTMRQKVAFLEQHLNSMDASPDSPPKSKWRESQLGSLTEDGQREIDEEKEEAHDVVAELPTNQAVQEPSNRQAPTRRVTTLSKVTTRQAEPVLPQIQTRSRSSSSPTRGRPGQDMVAPSPKFLESLKMFNKDAAVNKPSTPLKRERSKSVVSADQMKLQKTLLTVMDELESFEEWAIENEDEEGSQTRALRKMFGIKQKVIAAEREFETFRLRAGESSTVQKAMEDQMRKIQEKLAELTKTLEESVVNESVSKQRWRRVLRTSGFKAPRTSGFKAHGAAAAAGSNAPNRKESDTSPSDKPSPPSQRQGDDAAEKKEQASEEPERSPSAVAGAEHPSTPKSMWQLAKRTNLEMCRGKNRARTISVVSPQQMTLQKKLLDLLDEFQEFECWVKENEDNSTNHTKYLRRMFGFKQKLLVAEKEYQEFRLKSGESSRTQGAIEVQMQEIRHKVTTLEKYLEDFADRKQDPGPADSGSKWQKAQKLKLALSLSSSISRAVKSAEAVPSKEEEDKGEGMTHSPQEDEASEKLPQLTEIKEDEEADQEDEVQTLEEVEMEEEEEAARFSAIAAQRARSSLIIRGAGGSRASGITQSIRADRASQLGVSHARPPTVLEGAAEAADAAEAPVSPQRSALADKQKGKAKSRVRFFGTDDGVESEEVTTPASSSSSQVDTEDGSSQDSSRTTTFKSRSASVVSIEQLRLQTKLTVANKDLQDFLAWFEENSNNDASHTKCLRKMFAIKQKVIEIEGVFEAFRVKAADSVTAQNAIIHQISNIRKRVAEVEARVNDDSDSSTVARRRWKVALRLSDIRKKQHTVTEEEEEADEMIDTPVKRLAFLRTITKRAMKLDSKGGEEEDEIDRRLASSGDGSQVAVTRHLMKLKASDEYQKGTPEMKRQLVDDALEILLFQDA